MSPILVIFFGDYYCESLKISPKLVIDFSPILVTLFDHQIFTNFGDFFLDYFVELPKFSLKFVNNFVPILVTFFDTKNDTNFGNLFGLLL